MASLASGSGTLGTVTSGSGSSQANVSVQEFTIRVPKNGQRSYHVMRFNGNLGVDFGKWSQVKMERENNMKEFKGIDEDQRKFGAGSEFGREAKEEARRKKLGIVAKKYRADNQPWILKCYGSTVKKFKGIREGGISENTAYYVFTHAEDGAIEAFPLHEWYKFQSIQRYKALSAEEAEMEFTNRNKQLNFFSLMLRKRLKGEDDAELDDDGEKAKKTSKKVKELKISDMDEWMDSSENDSDSEKKEKETEEEEGKDKKKKKKGKTIVKPKKKRDTDLEAVEDSDDGDEEGREMDYISDSSDSEPENTNLDGVAEEKGLKKLLNSDEDESEDSDKEDKDKNNDEEEKEEEGEKKSEEDKDKKKKKKDKKKDKKKKENDPDDDFSSDSSSDDENKKKKVDKKEKVEKKDKDKKEVKPEPESASSSRSPTPTVDNKRKLVNEALAGPSKKPKLDLPNFIPGLAESGITEDAVRKYLMFKSKKTGLSIEQLVNIMTQILKKINPVKQTLKGKIASSSRSPTPTVDNKRKLVNEALAGPSKKPKLDLPNFIPGLAESGITEDAVRKYLMRNPEILQKFKSKKPGLSIEQLVNIMTQILKKINPVKQTLKGKIASSSRSPTPTVDNKRKLVNEALAGPSKKPKLDLPNFIPGLAESGITEDAVRKYLMRNPEILQKFKSKKPGLSIEQLVNIMTQILKKINPVKQTLKGKMYLSIKPS